MAISATGAGAATPAEVQGQIAAQNTRFVRALREGDKAALSALYTADAKVMPPGRPAVVGREAVLAFWTGGDLARRMQAETTLTTTGLEVFGDTAVETGQAVVETVAADQSRRRMDVSKYVVVWKRQDGAWRVHADIFNSDLPPAPRP